MAQVMNIACRLTLLILRGRKSSAAATRTQRSLGPAHQRHRLRQQGRGSQMIRISSRAFKSIAHVKRPASVAVLKECTIPVQQVGDRTLRWVISNDSVDREQDTISLKGW